MDGQVNVALLGLDGFAVTGIEEVDGELHIGVKTDGSWPVGCPDCSGVPGRGR